MARNARQIAHFRRQVEALSPPQSVFDRFNALVEAAEDIGSEDALEDLLMDAAATENWTAPWETPENRLTFRAKLIGRAHPEHHSDTGGDNSPAVEQAYRRGVDHGLACARFLLGVAPGSTHTLAVENRRVKLWRYARLQSRTGVAWGDFVEPDYPCRIRATARRSGLSLTVRWQVLERDGRRCVVCGATAADHVTLEVDHITPVSRGGTDALENLQTLCFDCNRGKSDRV